MKNKIRRLETCSFYDYTGMEARLEKMAAKGWMIERISAFGWVYRRIEPARLHFAVTWYPRASGFDPGPTEGQLNLQEFCAHTGWQHACTSAQMQIFYNQQEHPVPLETDPLVKADTIHQAAKRSALPVYFLLLAVAVLQCAMFLTGIRNHPIRVLSSPSALCSGMAWTVLFFLCASEIGGYFRWRSRAVKAAAQGAFVNVHGHSWQRRILLWVILPGFLYWLVTLLAAGPVSVRRIAIAVFLLTIALNVLVYVIRESLRRAGAPRNVNRTVTFFSIVFLSFSLTCAVLFAVFRSAGRGHAQDGQETYEYGGIPWAIRQEELPLTLEDLMEVDSSLYIRQHSENESLLLGQHDMQQYPRFDADGFSELPCIDYTITDIKLPVLYDLCRRSLLGDHPKDTVWQACDAAPWNAQEAWRLTSGSNGSLNRYLLCYPDRIVEIGFSWEPTSEQMAAAGKQFGSQETTSGSESVIDNFL